MLRGLFLDKFDNLLAAWRHHDGLRKSSSPLEQLAESRLRLDRLREEVNRLRRSFAPDPKEFESVLLTTFCDSYEETVFLYQNDAEWVEDRPRFRCRCGLVVDEAANRM